MSDYMNPWELYDELIRGIPDGLIVTQCNAGYNWTTVTSSEGGSGIAKTIPVLSVPYSFRGQIAGAPLKQIAELAKSWNFVEAAIGTAAIGAYYNHPSRVYDCGQNHPAATEANPNVFNLYREEVTGLKVTVVGHFPALEQKLGSICSLTVLEREPLDNELPDSACEYILPEQDYVFITGCTLVNKTMPRLLELSKNAKIVIVGPSTIISSVMFNFGVYGLSGMVVPDAEKCAAIIREGNPPALFSAGKMVNRIRDLI